MSENLSVAGALSTRRQIEDSSSNGSGVCLKNDSTISIGVSTPTAQAHLKGNLSTQLPNTATSSGIGNRDIASTTHGLNIGNAVKLPSGTAGAWETFSVASVTDANNFIVDSDLSNTISGATAYKDPDLFAVQNGDGADLLKVDKTGVDLKINGPWLDVRAFGATGDGVTDDFPAIQAALNINGPKTVYFPAGKYRITQELIVPNLTSIIGSGKYTTPTDSYIYAYTWIFFDPENSEYDKAVIRVSREAVGTEPSLSTWNVSITNIIIDGNNMAGFGLYIAYAASNSYFEKITIRKCSRHGLFVCKTYYATFRDIWAIDCKGCGMTFGPNPDVMGTAPFYPSWDDKSINGVLFENLYAKGCGTWFDGQDLWSKANKHKGYGIGIYTNTSCSFINLVCEDNRGTGLLYSPRHSTNIVKGVYLEGNCLYEGAKWTGLSYAYGIIYVGQTNQRGSIVENVYMNASTGIAQSIFLTGDEGVSPLILRNVWCGEKIESENPDFVLNDCDPALYSLVSGSSESTGAGFITNGNIGVGTTSPQKKLHVYNSGESVVKIEAAGNGNDARVILDVPTASGSYGTIDFYKAGTMKCQFYLNANTNHDLYLDMKNNGNFLIKDGCVGVGTTSPSAKLEVAGAVKAEQAIIKPQSTTPASPENGMLWYDNSGSPHRLKIYINGGWQTIISA